MDNTRCNFIGWPGYNFDLVLHDSKGDAVAQSVEINQTNKSTIQDSCDHMRLSLPEQAGTYHPDG